MAEDNKKSRLKLVTKISYDIIKKVSGFRKNLFIEMDNKRCSHIWNEASLKDVKKVAIINSASRSGSSLLFALIKQIQGIYSLSGESVPFYKLNGCFSDLYPSEIHSLEMVNEVCRDENLSRDFLNDFSVSEDQNEIMHNQDLLAQYIDDLVLRFSIQWPEIEFSYPLLKKLTMRAFVSYASHRQTFCKEVFYLDLFRFLRKEYPGINPYYYDIPHQLIKHEFPEIVPLNAPPGNILTIEEPPFILLSPNRKVTKDDLTRKHLLLKSTVDCYKMSLIERLFPNAEIKIIYLMRNPAASINGLYDGWLHRGFFSHNLENFFKENYSNGNNLKISGYSDQLQCGKWWWKFDLPPGWQDYIAAPLEQVCAFQWYTANRTIRRYLENSAKKYCNVKHENIVGGIKSRIIEMRKIIDFLGIVSPGIDNLICKQLPVIQATKSPKPFRWQSKKDTILPLLGNGKFKEMSDELGYHQKKMEEWL